MPRNQPVNFVLICTALFGLALESAAILLLVMKRVPFFMVLPLVIVGMFMAFAPAIAGRKFKKDQ
jgi:O-antigen ligase